MNTPDPKDYWAERLAWFWIFLMFVFYSSVAWNCIINHL